MLLIRGDLPILHANEAVRLLTNGGIVGHDHEGLAPFLVKVARARRRASLICVLLQAQPSTGCHDDHQRKRRPP